MVARQPWVKTVYWFAISMDADRIERSIKTLDDIQQAELGAFGFHEPKKLRDIRNRVTGDLMMKTRVTMTDEQLIAYALEQGRKAKAAEGVS